MHISQLKNNNKKHNAVLCSPKPVLGMKVKQWKNVIQ